MSEMAAKISGMKKYVDSSGRTITGEQAEQEYRKQLIVAGKPLEGAAYTEGLNAWLGTYREFTAKDQQSVNAAAIAFGAGFALSALLAIIALISGGGLIAFFVILIIGGILSSITAAIVIVFTTPAKKQAPAQP